MSSSEIEDCEARIESVRVTRTQIKLSLKDGREVAAPLEWYPRLVHATAKERNNYELSGGGYGIHWPDLDEDISVENVLRGQRSREGRRSFKIWLYQRRRGLKPVLEVLHIEEAKVIGPHQLRVTFNTGESKSVDLWPLLKGPVFKPLRDPEYFKLVRVDPECKTVTWPNGADLAPEALYELEGISRKRHRQRVA